jgi:hypothetical protein
MGKRAQDRLAALQEHTMGHYPSKAIREVVGVRLALRAHFLHWHTLLRVGDDGVSADA